MVQVKFEVRTGSARFRVSARVRDVQRALSLARARYPGGEVRVISASEPLLAVADSGDSGAAHTQAGALGNAA